jgi:hypothetical protein
MRQLLLTFTLLTLFIIAPQLGFTQYKSFFGKEVTSWNRVLHSTDKMGVDSITVLSSDTVRFNNNLYYRVSTGNVNVPPFPGPRRYLHYVVREDITYGRYYQYDTISKTEYLLMDMSLKKGDTFRTNLTLDTIVVDSVYFLNGLKHINITNIKYGGSPGFWTEGVGVLYMTLFTSLNFHGGGYDVLNLACQYKDGSHVYLNSFANPIYPDCNVYYYTGIPEETTDKNELNVYPNPATDRIIVKGIPSGEQATLKIYDMLGRLLVNNELLSNAHSTAHLPAGMYVAVVQNVQGELLYRTQLSVER